MNLYAGRIIKVDLSAGRVAKEPLRLEWLDHYWGSWGLAVKYYVDLVPPEVDPFSPENALVIMTGPLAGTLAPTSSRFCLVSKSPHSGTIFETNTGGAFAPELKFAGYDGIIITGKSERPVYLRIKDDDVSLEDASGLKGKGAFETEDLLKAAVGSDEAKVLCIGPAGENLVTFSSVNTEGYRQMGRGGAGALFGSKNLKGLVCRGTGGVKVADMKAFKRKVDEFKASSVMTDDNLWARNTGTSLLVAVTNELGLHPTHNFTYGFNEDHQAIGPDAILAAKKADRACSSCPLGCGKFTHINGAEVEGPEYETLCLAGSNCDMNDLEQIIRFNRLCDDLGLDTITSGNVIGLAMDLTESGRRDLGLHFGQPDDYLKAVEEIARLSTPRGRDLALGSRKLAEKYDARDLSTEVKGLEFPAYDPRASYGMGLAYATSERGACHMRAFTVFAENPFDLDAMAQAVAAGQNLAAIKWCMCFCDFWGTVNTGIMAQLLTAGLGREVTAEELDLAGERIWNLCRLFNLKAGLTAADDRLPEKIMRQALQKGPHAGRVLAEDDFGQMLQTYYRLRGWNEQGVPGDAKLRELGLRAL
ncbi:MAG: aldehyde ferredoxin oxidoreductase family protein [Pseudomonadota bacterium]